MMIAKRFRRLVNIEMPVTDAIKNMSQCRRIVQLLRKHEGLLKILACLGVVACCPQEAEINKRLPLDIVILTSLGLVQHNLKIVLRSLKVAEGFILVTPRTV